MPEPWDLTTDDERKEENITTFLIFCEDQNDEPFYFRSFEAPGKLKINCIPNQKKAKLNLINTINYCHQKGLMDCSNHTYKVKDGVMEHIWCVYDRDMEHADLTQILAKDDINFTSSINAATTAGINVGWSNDAFELWILLHFEKVVPGAKIHRDEIYERLTELFKKEPAVATRFSVALANGKFGYKTHLKERTAFLTLVLPVLKPKVGEAIKNAKELDVNFAHTIPYHDCNPCTKVYNLTERLIAAQ